MRINEQGEVGGGERETGDVGGESRSPALLQPLNEWARQWRLRNGPPAKLAEPVSVVSKDTNGDA